MPHVVLNGNVNMDDIFNNLKNLFIRSENGILKTDNKYISHDKTAIIIESLAIENGVNRGFLSMVGRRDDGVVIRIYPRTDVEKTPGVKLILANIAKQLLEVFPDLRIGETNLSEYLR